MAQTSERFSCLVNLAGIEYNEEIDLGLVGCYVYHHSDLLDVLVLSDEDQKLKIKNIDTKDKLRFECKLLGTNQQFLGSVSFKAEKLLAIAPGESWTQLLPIFDEGDDDEYKRDFGDIKVIPPCILLTFHPTGVTTTSVSSSNRVSRVSATQSRTSAQKTSAQAPASKGKSQKSSAAKGSSKASKGAKAANGTKSLEERVVDVVDELAGDMNGLQTDDRAMLERLEALDAHQQQLQNQHEADAQKSQHAQQYLEALLQAVEEMKEQDTGEVDELNQAREQLGGDVDAASGDLEALVGDTKDLTGFISDKSGETYDSENGTVQSKHKAIRKFLLNTLQSSGDQNLPLHKENEVLRKKVKDLRARVRAKFLDSDGASDEEINGMLREYEELLDQHAEAFKQLDQEANEHVDEFDKNGDLWKRLFTEGMELEK